MTTLIRIAVVVLIAIAPGAVCSAQTPVTTVAQAPPSEQQEGFVPIDQLPPQDQLPAAPLLVGAYAFVLLMLFGYMVLVSRKLTAVTREVDRLDADVRAHGRN